MAEVRAIGGEPATVLDSGWMAALGPPGIVPSPAAAAGLDWRAAPVPGTAAEVFPEAVDLLETSDIWYRCAVEATGPQTLILEGLATLAEVCVDGESVLSSRSMFLSHQVDFEARGQTEISLLFRETSGFLEHAKGPRARWRPMMITPGTLRFLRRTPLGSMPGWAPTTPIVGPWKPVTLVARSAPFRVRNLRLIPRLDGTTGRLDVALTLDQAFDGTATISCAGMSTPLVATGPATLAATLAIESVSAWWPHTHGEPVLHGVTVRLGTHEIDCGRVGFRSIAIDRGDDGKGFALKINGLPVFCRGASWMPPKPTAPGSADPRPLLELARDAGMNMLRLSGTMTPESQAFHDACDEMGILVWHDLPFANFDYPFADPAFSALCEREVRGLLNRLQASPSLAVVCGGSEIAQQATMLGLTPAQAAMPFFDETVPALVADLAPQAVHVVHSPSGGPLPFLTNEGVTHYFGVGAYRRPIEDARRSDVRFASECLAFANPPSPARLRAARTADPTCPRWKASIPRDLGADWDFEDVRDHYVGTLYGADPEALRASDPDRYLALGRAAASELMEAVLAEWRRAGSRCGGGLVWFLNDMAEGAGWGVIDDRGQPKAPWFALRRAFQPVHLGLTDEGLNGLGIHITNETSSALTLKLTLASYGDSPHPLAKAEADIAVAPRSSQSLSSAALIGRFFDITHAYRFGARAHEATLARLIDPETGAIVAEASHVLAGCAARPATGSLSVEVAGTVETPALRIAAERFARFVTIDDLTLQPSDQGFCLAPGETRLISLVGAPGLAPSGAVEALNAAPVRYGAA
ncbi:glycoside hydrolase family 2 protein [Phreatobacter aquaticus]|uniref:Glycoside hydrolase family 2 protein n=1 Tax=Phreatobacter aquaticus TaxID=2570229 RepID=A0A4D7QMN3_9HYPH|nr:glycoside hydrolase family 2 protein [Phreatobacter aquaticus]QCK88525.1 glycoside hydrolase family 2 protein [Phreatobacter aquaticus]